MRASGLWKALIKIWRKIFAGKELYVTLKCCYTSHHTFLSYVTVYHVFLHIISLSSALFWQKKILECQKHDFDHQMVCKAPSCWSKNTAFKCFHFCVYQRCENVSTCFCKNPMFVLHDKPLKIVRKLVCLVN